TVGPRTDHRRAGRHDRALDDRHTPQTHHAAIRDLHPDVALVAVLRELDVRPVDRVEDDTRDRQVRETSLQDRTTQRVDLRLALDTALAERIRLDARVRRDALQVRP